MNKLSTSTKHIVVYSSSSRKKNHISSNIHSVRLHINRHKQAEGFIMRRRLYTYTVYLAYIYVQSGHHYESFSLHSSFDKPLYKFDISTFVCLYIHIYWNYVVVSFLFLFLFLLLLYLLPAWYYILQYFDSMCCCCCCPL